MPTMVDGKIVLSDIAYHELQLQEAFSPENEWFAGEEFGHSPTKEEAVYHYAFHGGAENFAAKYISVANLEASKREKSQA